MSRFVDLRGQRFGRLVVIRRVENKGNKTMWQCECICGNKKVIGAGDLSTGRVNSCGCIRREMMIERNYIHGHSDKRIHKTWIDMKKRCNNPKNKSWNDYGGRGIQVCDEWKDDFVSFYNWAISNGYTDELTIDRIDVDGNYEPFNCRWVNKEVQANNTRVRKDSTTGITGISYSKVKNKFTVCIKKKYVGVYDTLEEAIKAKEQAEKNIMI